VQTVKIAKPSVKSLLIQMKFNGTVLSTGTGFLVDSAIGPHLITNRHNVTGRHQQTGRPLSKTGGIPNEISIAHNVKGKLGQWIWKTEPLYSGNTPRWVEHPIGGSSYDFVALPLMDINGVSVMPYDPGNTGANLMVGPSDVVSVIGFPFGLSTGGALAIWATGFVASEPFLPNDPKFLIDCRARPGQSGSAVISYSSGGAAATDDGSTSIFNGPVYRFLGVYSGRINDESDLGIVWKASSLRELVDTL